MQSMVLVMELSPHAFQTMGGKSTIPVFRASKRGLQRTGFRRDLQFPGKTDILTRVEDRNAFIAECKFWMGEKAFLAALDQLLSYLSWRDTKTARNCEGTFKLRS